MLLIGVAGCDKVVVVPHTRADQIGGVVGNQVRRTVTQTYTSAQRPPLEWGIADVQTGRDERAVQGGVVPAQTGNHRDVLTVVEGVFGKHARCELLSAQGQQATGCHVRADNRLPIPVVVERQTCRELVRHFIFVMLLFFAVVMMVVMMLVAPGVLKYGIQVAVGL